MKNIRHSRSGETAANFAGKRGRKKIGGDFPGKWLTIEEGGVSGNGLVRHRRRRRLAAVVERTCRRRRKTEIGTENRHGIGFREIKLCREREEVQLGMTQGRKVRSSSLSRVRFQPESQLQMNPNGYPASAVQFPFPQFTSSHTFSANFQTNKGK